MTEFFRFAGENPWTTLLLGIVLVCVIETVCETVLKSIVVLVKGRNPE